MSEQNLRFLVTAGDQDARRLLAVVPRMDTRNWPLSLRMRPIGWEGAQQQQIVRHAVSDILIRDEIVAHQIVDYLPDGTVEARSIQHCQPCRCWK